MRLLSALTALIATASAFILSASDATLDIVFDKVQTVKFPGGQSVQYDGEIREIDGQKVMVFGEKGYAVPVNGLVGEQGTFILKFALAEKMVQSPSSVRTLGILRLKGREQIGYYTFYEHDPLQHRFADLTNNFYGRTEKLKGGKIYCAALVWDGDRVYCYLDGKLTQETKQPFPVDAKRVNQIVFGPFNDNWYVTQPWHDDTFIREIRLYNRPLQADEIAAFSGVKAPSVRERYGRIIVAPKRTPAAARGMSYVSLINQTAPEKGWDLPKNGGSFAYDDQNLYIDFMTSFPGNTVIKKGISAGDPEASVWGSEDFELLLRHSGKTYYFAGAAGGGKFDMRDSDSGYNPVWDYRSSLSMRIDDTTLWEGKIAIPWKALELDAPPAELKVNFARSYFNSAVTAATDLSGQGGYWSDSKLFYTLKFEENTPALTVKSLGNPAYGNLNQEFELTSPVDCTVKFEIIQEHEKGLIRPQHLLETTYDLKANEPVAITVQTPLTTVQADRLVYRLSSADGKKIYLSQDVPIKVSAEYLSVTPLFTAGKLAANVKCSMLQTKFGKNANFTIELKDTQGKTLFATGKLADRIDIPFARNYPSGMYTLEIQNEQKEIITAKTFFFPGFGEWSTMHFDMTRILPPFTAMTYSNEDGFTANVVLRSYRWHSDSLLPAQITSRGANLLLTPAAIRVNGQPVKGSFKSTVTEKHRAEMSADARNSACQIQSAGWLEYDGVQHNEVKFTALQDISKVELTFELPRKYAKYLHTSACGWGNKITAKILDGKRDFRYFPVTFIGNEDRGLCFFAESSAAWLNAPAQPMSIAADADKAVFTVTVAQNVKKGQSFTFDYGVLAAPVKPQNKIYPLNTASWQFTIAMNRPGQTPTTWTSYLRDVSFISDSFADIPNVNNAPIIAAMQKQAEDAKAHNVHPFIYTPNYVSHEYPEVNAFSPEWETVPRQLWTGKREKNLVTLALLCPASPGADFVLYHIQKYLEKVKVDGINFDFGIIPVCSNELHGCHNRTPLIAYRNFFRKVAMLLLDSGAQEYIIHIHNTDSVQLPAYTFVTHLLNGEHIRQQSTPLMHNGKDILDSYPLEMFACELSSLPFGIYNAGYQSNDILTKENGGGKEDDELYKLRITRAYLTGMLIHNSISAINRCHYGIFDKIVRIYSAFGVPESEFIGYWDERRTAEVMSGKEVCVSCYRHPDNKRLLAVISHVGNGRLNQDVTVKFRPEALQMGAFSQAAERLEAEDKEYEELYKMREATKLSPSQQLIRLPLKWENPGIKVLDFKDNTLKLHLPAHSFAIVELE